MSVQLFEARTDHHLCTESYQRPLDNIFGVEGEVAGRIAAALQARLSEPEVSAVAQVPTTNPRAYDDYLRRLNFQPQAFTDDFEGNVPQAIAAFKRTVTAKPDCALAWGELSSYRAVAGYWGVDQSEANHQTP